MIQNNEPMSDDLLVKYLLGEASAAERSAVEAWAAAHPDNSKTLEQFGTLWQRSRQGPPATKPDTAAAWGRFQQRVRLAEEAERPKGRTMALGWKQVLRLAAAVVLLAGAGAVLWQYLGREPRMLAFEAGEATFTGTLPDGSTVTLNRHSRLSYPESFRGDSRNVTLTGEAFFDITANKARPFIIAANGVDVKVVGTSFNVRTASSETRVIVETGIVEVASASKSVRLSPNEEATVVKGGEPVKSRKLDDFYQAYRTGQLRFDGTPMQRVAEVLSEVYGVTVTVDNAAVGAMKSMSTSIAIGKDSIGEALTAVLPSGLRGERNGNQIIIKQ